MPDLPEFSPFLDLVLRHLPLSLLIVGIAFAVILLALLPKPHAGGTIVEVLFRSYLFWTIGVLFLYGAIADGAFGAHAAAAIHAPPVPATPEAAYASLAFAVIAFLALGRSTGLRIAAVVGPAIYWLAPLALAEPSRAASSGHASQVLIVLIGAFLLLLHANVGRVPAYVHPLPPAQTS